MDDDDLLAAERETLLSRHEVLTAEAERLSAQPFDLVAQTDYRRRLDAHIGDLLAYRLRLSRLRRAREDSLRQQAVALIARYRTIH